MPGAEPRALLEASFAELDAAIEALAKLADAATGDPAAAAPADSLNAERACCARCSSNAPVPLFVLEQDATVRRANAKAGELIGAPPGYATGKSLTAFIDPPSRAAVKSQLAAAIRTRKARLVECRLLGSDGPVDVTLAADVITLPDGARLVVVAAARPQAAPPVPAPAPGPGTARARRPASPPADNADGLVGAMTRRMDMITAVTRLLLDNSTFSEAVTLQRCARLLAGDIASWVIVDIERADVLRRQFVIGPHGAPSEELARKAARGRPAGWSVPAQVHAAARSVLLAHADDTGRPRGRWRRTRRCSCRSVRPRCSACRSPTARPASAR